MGAQNAPFGRPQRPIAVWNVPPSLFSAQCAYFMSRWQLFRGGGKDLRILSLDRAGKWCSSKSKQKIISLLHFWWFFLHVSNDSKGKNNFSKKKTWRKTIQFILLLRELRARLNDAECYKITDSITQNIIKYSKTKCSPNSIRFNKMKQKQMERSKQDCSPF